MPVGQIVGRMNAVRPVAELIAELVAEFDETLARLDKLSVTARAHRSFAPGIARPDRLRNRFIKAATFEGRTPHALVTDELIAFHRTVAAGGAGMTTVAYWRCPRRAAPTVISCTGATTPRPGCAA